MLTSEPSTSYEVRPISYASILGDPNATELLAQYSEECAIGDIGQPCPQVSLYDALEKSGSMRSFGVYEGTELVGFAAILEYVLPHYGKKVAAVESIFISKSYRTDTGKALMGAIENQAKADGCTAVLYSARAGTRFERLLERLAFYQRTNSVFLRKL